MNGARLRRPARQVSATRATLAFCARQAVFNSERRDVSACRRFATFVHCIYAYGHTLYRGPANERVWTSAGGIVGAMQSIACRAAGQQCAPLKLRAVSCRVPRERGDKPSMADTLSGLAMSSTRARCSTEDIRPLPRPEIQKAVRSQAERAARALSDRIQPAARPDGPAHRTA